MLNNIIKLITDNSELINTSCIILISAILLYILVNKLNNQRPKVIVNLQLIRNSIACLAIENCSNVAAEVKSITFNEEFLLELDNDLAKKLFSLKKTHIYLAPAQKLFISLDVDIAYIIDNFVQRECNVKYVYAKPSKKWNYMGRNTINFEECAQITLYMSELGELNDTLKKVNDALDKIANMNSEVIKEINETDLKETKSKTKSK